MLQQKLDQLEISSDPPSRRHDEDKNWCIIRDELHRQAAHMRALETTNTRLSVELGMYKDRHGNIEVMREEKRALERKVAVMEELREQVVSLEAQVEAARQERQAWLVSPFLQRPLPDFHYRANKSNESSTPSKPSLSVVQNLSELRLTHARLFQEHGATLVILRSREAELAKLQESLSEAQSTISVLHAEVRGLKDKVTRRDQRVQLADRELGFLQALVVRILAVLVAYLISSVQASYTAEQGMRDTPPPDSSLSQRIQQLEQSLQEYKAVNNQLQEALDAVDAEENAGGVRQTRKELRAELELQKADATRAVKGIGHEAPYLLFKLTYWYFQSLMKHVRLLRPTRTGLKSLNRPCGS